MNEVELLIGTVPESEKNKWELVVYYMEPIVKYYQDPDVTEIMINRYDRIFIEDKKGKRLVEEKFTSENDLQRFIKQLANALGQDDPELQILDARFPDQSRACCTMVSVTPLGATATIRCAPKQTLTFSDLISFGSLSQEMCDFLHRRVEMSDNIIVSGSTGSGKTTLIRALAEFIPPEDRVLVCEDTQELFLNLPNQIPMEAPKRRNSKLNLSDLIKTTLRQRPDRVIVGEIRDALACDAFLQIINTGHGGCCTSLHANNPAKAVRRIQYLLAKEGLIDFALAEEEIKASVNLLIQADRTPKGKKITDISTIEDDGRIRQLFRYDLSKDAHEAL